MKAEGDTGLLLSLCDWRGGARKLEEGRETIITGIRIGKGEGGGGSIRRRPSQCQPAGRRLPWQSTGPGGAIVHGGGFALLVR